MHGARFFVFRGFYHANIIALYATRGKLYCIDDLFWEGKDFIYTK